MQILLVSLLVGMQACTGCYELGLPGAVGDDPGDETNSPVDTSGEEDTGDLPPPPLCEFPEVEPNNNLAEANPIDPESWACGTLLVDDLDPIGLDYVTFEAPASGWISMWGRGETIGSAADIDMNVFVDSDFGSDLVVFERTVGSHESFGMLPIEQGDVFQVALRDAFSGNGEGYVWEFLGSMEKGAPLDWTMEEDEVRDGAATNDTFAAATQTLASGDRVFGVVGNAAGDKGDIYKIEVPEGITTIELTVEAWEYGSPLNSRIKLYRPDVIDQIETEIEDSRAANNAYRHSETWDPYISYTATEAGTWYVSVLKAGDYFGPYHWYVLSVNMEAEPIDTATP